MKVKYLARLLYNDVKPVNVTDETAISYKTTDGTGLHRKVTNAAVLFGTELDAKRFIVMQLNRRKNEHRSAYQNAQKDLLDALVRFGLEQCEACNEFHAVGAEHDCEHHPF